MSQKKMKRAAPSFDVSDISEPLFRWQKADKKAQDMVIVGIELVMQEISSDTILSKKLARERFGALEAARDLLWGSR